MHEFQYIQCSRTKNCQNDKCFWKQRDCYGLEPFPCYSDEDGEMPGMKKNEEVTEKYGESYFPEMSITVGTNCLYVICDDYQEAKEEND